MSGFRDWLRKRWLDVVMLTIAVVMITGCFWLISKMDGFYGL